MAPEADLNLGRDAGRGACAAFDGANCAKCRYAPRSVQVQVRECTVRSANNV